MIEDSITKNFMMEGSDESSSFLSLLGYLTVSQSVFETQFDISSTIYPQLYVKSQDAMIEFDSENLYLEACDSSGCKKASEANNYEFQSLNLEDSSLKMRTDV